MNVSELWIGDGITDGRPPRTNDIDLIYGRGGYDILSGLGGNDVIRGDDGNDVIFGGFYFPTEDAEGEEEDALVQDGNDNLNGGNGDDFIVGGTGNDNIDGGRDNDFLIGGTFQEYLLFTGEFDGLFQGINFSGTDFGDAGIAFLYRGALFESGLRLVNATVQDGRDILSGGSGDDIIYGLGGDDNLSGGSGNDEMYGGSGDDLLSGSTGNDFLDGGSGDDDILGGGGLDIIAGGYGNDLISSSSGDDVIFGGRYDDGLLADIIANLDVDATTLEFFQNIFLFENNAAVANFLRETDNDEIVAGSGNDLVYAGDGDDSIVGGSGNDTLYGEAGFDEILAGDGNDVVFGGSDDDVIEGGTGTDQLFGEAGDDTIDGGSGTDRILGGAGLDILTGGAGNDRYASGAFGIFGEAGDDYLSGTSAAAAGANEIDEVTGGAGFDTFVLMDTQSVYYSAAGDADYVIIRDFVPEDDFLGVNFDLLSAPSIGNFDIDGNGTADGAAIRFGGELVAVTLGFFASDWVAAINEFGGFGEFLDESHLDFAAFNPSA
jgi:Ca2+-binding RTX toxin-like protein